MTEYELCLLKAGSFCRIPIERRTSAAKKLENLGYIRLDDEYDRYIVTDLGRALLKMVG